MKKSQFFELKTIIHATRTACFRAADTIKQLQLPVVYVTFRHVMGEYKEAPE